MATTQLARSKRKSAKRKITKMGTPNIVTLPAEKISVTKTVFDLDTKSEVTLKKIGEFAQVATMQEFVARCENDTALILRLVNSALKEYASEQLSADESVPFQSVESDDDGNETLVPFSGTPLTAEKSAQLSKNVVEMARLLFGYDKVMVANDKAANAAAKKEAKNKALDMILGNPAVIEALKK